MPSHLFQCLPAKRLAYEFPILEFTVIAPVMFGCVSGNKFKSRSRRKARLKIFSALKLRKETNYSPKTFAASSVMLNIVPGKIPSRNMPAMQTAMAALIGPDKGIGDKSAA